MTVHEMIKKCYAETWHFIVESNLCGGVIYDGTNPDEDIYEQIEDWEVKHWGVHNAKENTFVLYV